MRIETLKANLKSSDPIILFRPFGFEEEYEACVSIFGQGSVLSNRNSIPKDKIVVGRYSVLPFYKELEQDIRISGSAPITDFREHRYIAGFHWYEDLREYTFESYDDTDFYKAPEGAYVVKGETNSKKIRWNEKMFASTKKEAQEIASDLVDDGALLGQRIIYRRYTPLKTFETGLYGLPITNEWRFFFLGSKIIDYGYYWDNLGSEEAKNKARITQEGINFAIHMAEYVQRYNSFFVVDIAEMEDGRWVLVEINDAQMSGLSAINPVNFYTNLKKELTNG